MTALSHWLHPSRWRAWCLWAGVALLAAGFVIEHMSRCQDQLEWANDGETQTFLADALLGDLTECQKLCEQLRTGHSHETRARSLVTM